MKPDANATGMNAPREPADREDSFTEISVAISEAEFEMARALAGQQGMTFDEWVAVTVRRELEGEVVA